MSSYDINNIVQRNSNGGFCTHGEAFSKAKWMEIIEIYVDTITDSEDDSPCSTSKLSRLARVSWKSAEKAILYYEAGVILDTGKRGHHRSGIGSLMKSRFDVQHHAYIYKLYRRNPARPISSYVSKLKKKYDIKVSDSFISRWFKTIGTFKGTMRATSKFPPAKDTWQSLYLVKQYFALMYALEDHTNIIFADEKHLKEIDIYGKVRRDVYTGEVPTIKCNANSRNG